MTLLLSFMSSNQKKRMHSAAYIFSTPCLLPLVMCSLHPQHIYPASHYNLQGNGKENWIGCKRQICCDINLSTNVFNRRVLSPAFVWEKQERGGVKLKDNGTESELKTDRALCWRERRMQQAWGREDGVKTTRKLRIRVKKIMRRFYSLYGFIISFWQKRKKSHIS